MGEKVRAAGVRAVKQFSFKRGDDPANLATFLETNWVRLAQCQNKNKNGLKCMHARSTVLLKILICFCSLQVGAAAEPPAFLAVVKPVESAGSDGVTRCRTFDEVLPLRLGRGWAPLLGLWKAYCCLYEPRQLNLLNQGKLAVGVERRRPQCPHPWLSHLSGARCGAAAAFGAQRARPGERQCSRAGIPSRPRGDPCGSVQACIIVILLCLQYNLKSNSKELASAATKHRGKHHRRDFLSLNPSLSLSL